MSDNRKLAVKILVLLFGFPLYLWGCGWWGGFVVQNHWDWGVVLIFPLAPFWLGGLIYCAWLWRRDSNGA